MAEAVEQVEGRVPWRANRCLLSSDLTDPATEDEKSTWDCDLVPALAQCEHLEDCCRYYTTLGCTKCSSDLDIAKFYARLKKKFRRTALTGHPDKTKDKKLNAKFQRASSKFDLVQKAYDVLGTPDADGCYPCRDEHEFFCPAEQCLLLF